MKVTIIGLGGIGSHLANWVAMYLHALKREGDTLTLVDGDIYEDKNRSRQHFGAIGPKAKVQQEELTRQFEGLCVNVIAEYLTPENADFILLEDELALLAVDNHATRKLASDVCGQRQNFTLISGGNDKHVADCYIYARREGRDVAPPLTDRPEIATPQDERPDEIGCDELLVAGVPQMLAANLAAASMMFNAFHRFEVEPEGVISKIVGADGLAQETAYNESCADVWRNRVMSRKIAVQQSQPTPAPSALKREEASK